MSFVVLPFYNERMGDHENDERRENGFGVGGLLKCQFAFQYRRHVGYNPGMSERQLPTRRYAFLSFAAGFVFAWNGLDGLPIGGAPVGGWRQLISCIFAIYAFSNGLRILFRGDLD